MTTPRYGWGEGFSCQYEWKYSQKHLQVSRAETERSRLNMASRLDWAMVEKGVGGREKREAKEIQKSTWPKWQGYTGIRSWRKESISKLLCLFVNLKNYCKLQGVKSWIHLSNTLQKNIPVNQQLFTYYLFLRVSVTCPLPTTTLCFFPLSLPLSLCLLLLVLGLFLYPQLPGLPVWKFQVYTQDKDFPQTPELHLLSLVYICPNRFSINCRLLQTPALNASEGIPQSAWASAFWHNLCRERRRCYSACAPLSLSILWPSFQPSCPLHNSVPVSAGSSYITPYLQNGWNSRFQRNHVTQSLWLLLALLTLSLP